MMASVASLGIPYAAKLLTSSVYCVEVKLFRLFFHDSLALNEHLLNLFIDLFELEPTLIKSHANYRKLLDYGAIAL